VVIEKSILIHTSIVRVWDTFTDLACWKDWSRVITPIQTGGQTELAEGGRYRFCLRPFFFPVEFEPLIEEVKPHKQIVWSAARLGVQARHEFLFKELKEGVLVTSRESYKGPIPKIMKSLFPFWRLRQLTVSFLKELKKAAEG
jgi:hypothetical protein